MVLADIARRWAQCAAEVVFPPQCHCCRETGAGISGGLCSVCFQKVPYIDGPLCSVCGRNFVSSQPTAHFCGKCLRRPPPYSRASAITYYEEPVRTLLHRLKYRYDTTTIGPLLKIARSFDISPFESCDIIVPVPLYRHRLQDRGMNQALVLARLLFADIHSRVLPGILVKKRQTPSQTACDAAGRRRNLRGAFAVCDSLSIRDKKICLVDDIYTTGTTVAECAQTMMQANAAEIVVLTFARVREAG
ncbi:MAG TPA: ComF family protein [Desulfopila sp.]|nr:ComF family protein [Desulfopila sp.]